MFFRGSRYEGIATAEIVGADGSTIRYKRIRYIGSAGAEVFSHSVVQGDRLDLIAWKFYRDPEQFWRICDANLAMRPDELTEETGRRLVIPVPGS